MVYVVVDRYFERFEDFSKPEAITDSPFKPIYITHLSNAKHPLFKGALDNILKFYFWLNFIYHVKCNC